MDIIKRGKQLIVAVGIIVAASTAYIKMDRYSQQEYEREFHSLPKAQQEVLVKIRNTPNLTEIDVGREMQELMILNNAVREHDSRWLRVKAVLDQNPGSDKFSLSQKINALAWYLQHDLPSFRNIFRTHIPRLRYTTKTDFEKYLDDLEKEIRAIEKQFRDLDAQRAKLK